MKLMLKHCALSLLLATTGWASAQAAGPSGKQVSGAITLEGGSSSAVKWPAPLTTTYKVHVFVPKNGTTENALYRIYPNGKQAGSTNCISTAPTYPCYEVTVDQTQHQNSWLQLTLNNNADTQWQFTKAKGFVAAVADNLWATESLNLSALLRFENTGLAIGKTYQGGIIFYLDQTGEHGLIAAPADQGNMPWKTGTYLTTGATDTTVGAGLVNTTKIVDVMGAFGWDSAARFCTDLAIGAYSDWHMPSRDELQLLYQNIGPGAAAPLTNIGGFSSNVYWSSSEYDYYSAWNINFSNGQQDYYNKDFSHSIRAVRAF